MSNENKEKTVGRQYAIYTRVSTKMQGESGLGLEAQRQTCLDYIKQQGGGSVMAFKDVESGAHRDRPGLWAAIEFCKKNDAKLVIAKLDRLCRDVEFTFRVINEGIDIHFCDMPVVNTIILGVFASVAQYERELISERTKAALAAKKARGVKQGRPKGTNMEKACMASADMRTVRAAMLPVNRMIWEISAPYVKEGQKGPSGEAFKEILERLRRMGVTKTATGLDLDFKRLRTAFYNIRSFMQNCEADFAARRIEVKPEEIAVLDRAVE